MRILAIADVEEKLLWGSFNRHRFEGIDLILAAGDLDPDYLEFLVTMLNTPLLYVHGNHDDKFRKSAPGGCICLDDSVYVYQGIRIAGLAGSRKYRDGKYMYTEREMARQIRRIDPRSGFWEGSTFCSRMRRSAASATSRICRIRDSSASMSSSSAGIPATTFMGTCMRIISRTSRRSACLHPAPM